MATIGFARTGAQYHHPRSAFFVEFPAGPLAIGDDDLVQPVEVRVGSARVLTLSATDSCRDRLAAYYHWSDLQSLRVAAAIARRNPIDIAAIRAWSVKGGRAAEFRRLKPNSTSELFVGTALAAPTCKEPQMKPSSPNVANDPTIMGNEKPRRSDDLPEGEEIQEEDPRNGLNLPVVADDDDDADEEEAKG